MSGAVERRVALVAVMLVAVASLVPVIGVLRPVVAGAVTTGTVTGTPVNFGLPFGEVTDGAGDVYVADQGGCQIWLIGASGTQSIIGGDGTDCPGAYSSGDGGPATSAHIVHPESPALDAAGNLDFLDFGSPSGDSTIRQINGMGIISTIAGGGTNTGDGASELSARLDTNAIAIDASSNIYLATRDCRARMIPAAGGTYFGQAMAGGAVYTIAGTGTCGYSGDGGSGTAATMSSLYGVAVDLTGNVFISDALNHRVRRIAAATDIITTYVGNGTSGNTGDGGLATSATIKSPGPLATDGSGALFFVNGGYARIRRVDAVSHVISLAVGGGGLWLTSAIGTPATSVNLGSIAGVAVTATGDLVFDNGNGGSAGAIGHGWSMAVPVLRPQPPIGAILAAERVGAKNPAVKNDCLCGQTNYPIDPSTGNQYETRTDLSTPGRGLPLALSETYNSLLAASPGPLGFGWSWSYGMSLTNPDGTPLGSSPTAVVLNQETGSQEAFALQGGLWTAPPRVEATLTQNGDGTWTVLRGSRETLQFDTTGRLVSEADLNGETTTISRPNGTTLIVTDPAARTLTATLDTSVPARITQIVDTSTPARTVRFSYDGSGNLAHVIDIAGGDTAYGYDASHRLVTMRKPRFSSDGALPAPVANCAASGPAHVVSTHYDANGRVDCQYDPLGRETTFAYTGPGSGLVNSATVTDPNANVSVYAYTNGELTSLTRGYGTPNVATWSYLYDPTTLGLTLVVDPNGHYSKAIYDSRGNRTSATDALGRTTTWTYDAHDDITSLTPPKKYGPSPATTTYSYDEAGHSSGGAGNLTTVSTPVLDEAGNFLATKTITYDHLNTTHPGDVTDTVDAAGNMWSYTYDAVGDRTSVTAPATSDNSDGGGSRQNVAKYAWDTARGFMTATLSPRYVLAHPADTTCTPPAVGCTTYTHDPWGHATVTTDANGHTSTVHYDADQNVDYTIDANTNQTTNVYDAAEQLTQVTRPDLSTLKTNYWPDGSIEDQIDGNNADTHYTYDPLRHLTGITDPDSRTTGYQYDAVGNLLVKADPGISGCTPSSTTDGCRIYHYDAADEATAILYNDPATPDVTNVTYDDNGQRSTMAATGLTTATWKRDSLGRLYQSTDANGATIGYGYDTRSNLTTITYPGTTGTVTRDFDPAGRMDWLQDWNANQTNFTYDADSNLTSQQLPASVTDTYAFDNADHLNSITDTKTSTTFASFTYGRDNASQLTSVTSTGVPADNHSYHYTTLEQLNQVDATNYSYDAGDNPTKLAAGTTQAFDPADQLQTTTPTPTTVGAAPAVDKTVSAQQVTAATHVVSPSFTTSSANELLLAFVSIDGASGGSQSASSVTGGGLTWSLAGRANTANGTAEVWQTYATTVVTGATVTANFASTTFDGAITVATFTGAAPTVGATAIGANTTGAPTVPITTTTANAVIWGVGTDWTHATARTANTGQTVVNQVLDTRVAKTYWTQKTATVPTAGTTTMFGDSAPSADRWDIAAVEITPAAVGNPRFGPDKIVHTDQGTAATHVTSPALSTTNPNELVLAFVSADGSSTTAQTVSSVTGGGLTWTLASRANGAHGTAEVWQAYASTTLSNATVTANFASTTFDGAITVTAFSGAANVVGATATGNNTTGAPTISLTTTKPGSLVWGVGTDWTHATNPTPRSGQTIVNQFPDARVTKDFWTQNTGTNANAGTNITFGDTAPTVDRWDLAAVEVINGNLTTFGYNTRGDRTLINPGKAPSTTVYYDAADRLSQYGSDPYYLYDGDGLRMSKTVLGVRTSFAWDQAESVPLTLTAGTTSYIYGPDNLPLEQVTGTTTSWLHHDQLGSTRVITDATGTVAGTFTYDAYGKQTTATGTTTSAFGYAGQYTDTESGLIYMRARYYDPTTAQFLTVDPLVAQTRSPYGYTSANPVNHTDITGLDWGCLGNFCLSDGAKGAANFGIGAYNALTGSHYCGYSGPGLDISKSIGGATAKIEIGLAVGGLGAETAAASETEVAAEASDDESLTVRHYSDDLGRNQIEESGYLRSGTYVTLPGEIPPGTSSEGIEKLLEVETGKGANYVDVQVPGSQLGVPESGLTTSGGIWQRILLSPVELGDGGFVP